MTNAAAHLLATAQPRPAQPGPGAPRTAEEILAWTRRTFGCALRDAVDTLPATLRRSAAYHLGWQGTDGLPARAGAGKALRPALVLLAAAAVGGNPQAAVGAAVAVELVHNFSLVQDDVMDGDRTRRHRPTVWVVFGIGEAILLGDALLTLAFEVLAATEHPRVGEQGAVLRAAVQDLLEGQSADLAFERRDHVEVGEYQSMARGKTAALLGAAAALGACCGGGDTAQVQALRRFGADVGLAFQFVDDLLGIWGDPAVTGKPDRSDLANRKKSLPVVAALASGGGAATELGALYAAERELSAGELARAAELIELSGARAFTQAQAAALLTRAIASLDTAGCEPTARDDLVGLAHQMVHRDH